MNSKLKAILVAWALVLPAAGPLEAQRIQTFHATSEVERIPQLSAEDWADRQSWILPVAGAIVGGTVAYLVNPDCGPENEYVCPLEVGGQVLLWAAAGGLVGFLVDRLL